MMRRLLPFALIAATLLTACSAQPPEKPATPSAPAADTTPAPAEKPPEKPVETKPTVQWLPSGIGYPLVPSDPAAAEQKVAMLTFDDGPTDITPAVLDALAKEKVKAVFFITGYSADKHPELLKRIHDEGHVLAIHSETHANLSQIAPEEIRGEIEPLAKRIAAVTGQPPKYIRPPYGAYNDAVLQVTKEMGLQVINWSNGSLDWEGVVNGYKDPKKVVADVMSQLHKGAVVLMHDTNKHTA